MNRPTWLRSLAPVVLLLVTASASLAQPPPTEEQLEVRLEALNAALDAGILTDAEYQQKKAAIEAQLRALAPPLLDEAATKKLQALDAARASGILTDEEYARKKAEITGQAALPEPAAAPPSEAKGLAPLAPTPTAEAQPHRPAGAAAMQTYTHPLGFQFQYPHGWRAQAQAQGIQLIPPDAKTTPQGPAEVYLVGGESAEGVAAINSPQVIQYYENQVRMFAPFLRRTGQVGSVHTAGGPGIVLTWEGTNPQGKAIVAQLSAVLLKGHGITLLALGEREQVAERSHALRRIFASFGFGKAATDPRLVGTWKYEKTYTSGTFGSVVVRYYQLRPDGTLLSSGRAMAGMEHTDSGGSPTGWSHGDTGEAGVDRRGRWGGRDGKLHLLWSDGGAEEFSVHVEGAPGAQSMLLKPVGGGKNRLWKQVQ